jgi:S-adenosylmethionine:tRNA ribosyltransferase-isomerase
VRTADFDYELPPEYIAQRPLRPRDSSRLMLLDRAGSGVSHHIFHDLPRFLAPGDALVINQTRVLPMRLAAQKVPSGGRAEILLLRPRGPRIWEAMLGGKGLKPGRLLSIPHGPQAEVIEDLGGALRLVRFTRPIEPLLSRLGEMPLPPYIHTPLQRPDEYQTVFARLPGSAAAPTAGLHFTRRLLRRMRGMGVHIVPLTLHIGLDTFAPVNEDDPRQHTIHTEWCELGEDEARLLNQISAHGGRIIAVGTTSVRTLESAAGVAPAGQRVAAFHGPTDLFILPGHEFRAVDALLTNFHLPRSTLLMLVSAFAGRERILEAYQVAMQEGYRFYSFGDAMLIL